MRERRGVYRVMLNAIIGLVLIGITFSLAFFIYSGFVEALTTSQITKGFDNFLDPLRQVCEGELQGTKGDISLPITGLYTHGIIQTRVSTYLPEMPLAMRACEGAYCLCLFRLDNPNTLAGDRPYDSWDPTPHNGLTTFITTVMASGTGVVPQPGTPPPIWHFNNAGLRIFPAFVNRVVQFLMIKVIEQIAMLILNSLIGHFTCMSTASLIGPYSALALLACNAVIYGIVIGLAQGAINALNMLLEESSEPFMLVNYPQNFMSVPVNVVDPSNRAGALEYLNWIDDDGGCTNIQGVHDPQDCFQPGLAVASLDSNAWEAIGLSFAQGFLEGFVDGMFKGISKGTKQLKGAKELKGFSKVIASKSFRVLSYPGRKLAKAFTKIAAWGGAKLLEKEAGLSALDFEFPESFRPKATVRALLGTRRVMNIDDFVTAFNDDEVVNTLLALTLTGPFGIIVSLYDLITSGTRAKSPNYDYSFDDSVKNFDGFDIVNCVKISDLGPKCDENTVVLMDYSHDVFLSYRVTDPINFPAKAIFCGYDPDKKEFDINLIEMLADALKRAIEDALSTDIFNFIIDFVGDFLELVLGDWLLAGMHSMSGLFMECVQPHYNFEPKTEYFQYWVPYLDRTGYVGATGSIGLMKAELAVPAAETSCRRGAIEDWRDCACNYWAKAIAEPGFLTAGEQSGVTTLRTQFECSSPNYSGDYENELMPTLIAFDEMFPLVNGSLSVFTPVTMFDYDTDLPTGADIDLTNREEAITCQDWYYQKYLKCVPGIHVEFGGVIQ